MRAALFALACLLSMGCSVLLDPSRYVADGGGVPRTDGAVFDAEARLDGGLDGGTLVDAGPFIGVPIEDFCEEFARGVCAWAVRCVGFTSCDFGPVAYARSLCLAELGEVAAGRVDYDPVAAEACLEATRAYLCGAGGPPMFAFKTLCPGTFIPQQRIGDDCYYTSAALASECIEGICTYNPGACPGVCAPYRSVGNTCDGYGLVCDPTTSYCDLAAGPMGTCRALVAEGQLCTGPCQPGLACLPQPDSMLRCVMQETEGGTCANENECQYPLLCSGNVCTSTALEGEHCRSTSQCPSGLFCAYRSVAPSGYVCQRPVAAGEACSDPFLCPTGLQCLYEFGSGTQRCLSPVTVGQPCTHQCAGGLFCLRETDADVGTCQPARGAGESCMGPLGRIYDACRYPNQCMDNGACHPSGRADGDPCSWNNQGSCAIGLWCEQVTHVCRAPVANGEACSPLFGRQSCATGYCPCTATDPECTEGFFDEVRPGEVCTAFTATGDPCSRLDECADGWCAEDPLTGDRTCTTAPTTLSVPCFGPTAP